MQTLATDWGPMAYLDTGGAGLPLLLLHGSGCDSDDWAEVIRLLPSDTRVLAIDFRGHGRSAVPAEPFTLTDLADDALRLVAHLELPRVILVGHSLGGMAAMDALRRSSAVAGLVLLEGWTSLAAANAFNEDRFYGGLPQATCDAIRRKAEATQRRIGGVLWDRFWESLERFDARDDLAEARMPIVEVYGGRGRNRLTKDRLQVPANPCIEWMWVAEAGHYLPHERPAEVARACLRCVEKATGS